MSLKHWVMPLFNLIKKIMNNKIILTKVAWFVSAFILYGLAVYLSTCFVFWTFDMSIVPMGGKILLVVIWMGASLVIGSMLQSNVNKNPSTNS